MSFNTFQWLQDTAKPYDSWSLETRPRITCADGFSMSVQAREAAYCSPRNNVGPWSACEVGYPSEAEPLLMDWVEDANRPTDTVYTWVPVEVIDAVIAKHGGVKPDHAPNI